MFLVIKGYWALWVRDVGAVVACSLSKLSVAVEAFEPAGAVSAAWLQTHVGYVWVYAQGDLQSTGCRQQVLFDH